MAEVFDVADIRSDDAGLTNARDNNLPLASKDEINRLLELTRKPRSNELQHVDFGIKDTRLRGSNAKYKNDPYSLSLEVHFEG